MSTFSTIEWTEVTWNPVTGCTKISDGCRFCYAERMSKDAGHGAGQIQRGVRGRCSRVRSGRATEMAAVTDRVRQLHVGSVSRGGAGAIHRSRFEVMNRATQHTFQTKRPGRAAALDKRLRWSPNIWLGTSIESKRWMGRVDQLKAIGAHTRFLSLEPLLGPLPGIPLHQIDWVIVGGESGPGARPMEADWVRDIRDNCLERKVPFRNGAAYSRRRPAGYWMIESGIRCPR